MRENGFRDEDVAVRVDVSAQSVRAYRLNKATPSGPVWQKLRDSVPGFAERIDNGKPSNAAC